MILSYEDRYKDLKYAYERLREEHIKLKKDYNELESRLSSAEFKIKNELEPRIQKEKRAYDIWVTNPET